MGIKVGFIQYHNAAYSERKLLSDNICALVLMKQSDNESTIF
jgi:hypothetical protein